MTCREADWYERAWGQACRELEECRAEVRRLQNLANGLAVRVAAQAELLAARAERRGPDAEGAADDPR